MNVHFSYKVNKTPDIEKEINQQIEKIRKRLQVFRPELIHLKGIVEQNSAREGFAVSLNLRLPSGQMAAQEHSPTATTAIKGAFEDLVEQLTKHKDHLRNQHKWPRWRRVGRTRPQPQVPFEETVAAVQPPTVSSEDISGYVNANLGRLQRFVERELRYRESIDQLAPETLTSAEVLMKRWSMRWAMAWISRSAWPWRPGSIVFLCAPLTIWLLAPAKRLKTSPCNATSALPTCALAMSPSCSITSPMSS